MPFHSPYAREKCGTTRWRKGPLDMKQTKPATPERAPLDIAEGYPRPTAKFTKKEFEATYGKKAEHSASKGCPHGGAMGGCTCGW